MRSLYELCGLSWGRVGELPQAPPRGRNGAAVGGGPAAQFAGDTPGRKPCGIKAGGRKRPAAAPHRPAKRGGTRDCGDWGAGIIGGRFGSLRGSWVVGTSSLAPQTRMKSAFLRCIPWVHRGGYGKYFYFSTPFAQEVQRSKIASQKTRKRRV